MVLVCLSLDQFLNEYASTFFYKFLQLSYSFTFHVDQIVSISLARFGVPFQGDFHAKKSFWSHSAAHLARNSIMTYY